MDVRNIDAHRGLGVEASILAVLLAAETAVLAGYFLLTPTTLAGTPTPRYLLYPFVWINLAVVASVAVERPTAPPRWTLVAGVLALLYAATLLVLGGVVTEGSAAPTFRGITVGHPPPGFGPRVSVVTESFSVNLIPYRLVGFAALSYLVFVRLLDITAAVVSGTVGLFACASCSFPIVFSLAAGVGNGTLAASVYTLSLDVSTAAFVLSVGLLYWLPELSFDRTAWLRG